MSIVVTSSYSFHRLVKSGEATLEDAPALAREAGAEAIEFALGSSLSQPLDLAMAGRLSDACASAEMPVCSVVVAAELLRGTDGDRRRAVKAVITQLEAAASMGARRFRHDASLGPESGDLSDTAFDVALPILAGACREVARRAQDLGVRSSIENHGRFVQHADRVARLVEQVDHPAFGVTFDVGNSLFAAQDHVEAARRLAPHAITVHVKDFIIHPPGSGPPDSWKTYEGGPVVVACALDEGDVRWRECVKIALRVGFNGPFVVEFEGTRPSPQAAVQRGIDRLRSALG